MIPLNELSPVLPDGPLLLLVLVGLGGVIGILTGLFGVGGAFLLNPLLMVLLRVDPSVVVGSSLSFTIGTGTAGTLRHMRSKNVELYSMVYIGAGAILGAFLGGWAHGGLKARLGEAGFDQGILILYLVLLMVTAWLVARGSEDARRTRSLLQRLPLGPRVNLRTAKLAMVSIPGLLAVGIIIGIAKGMLGIGGGVLFMPLLLLVVGLPTHQAIGTSLGVVLFSSIAGTIDHSLDGHVSLWLAMSLLVGSSLGVQFGAWLCDRLQAKRIRRWFTLVVLLSAAVVAADLFGLL